MSRSRNLTDLRNIGKKIAGRLNEVGILSDDDLRQVGAVGAHRMIKERHPDETLPVCYYLYSSEGALLTSIGMKSVSTESWNSKHEPAHKALHRTAIPLRFIAAGQLRRYSSAGSEMFLQGLEGNHLHLHQPSTDEAIEQSGVTRHNNFVHATGCDPAMLVRRIARGKGK